MPYPWLTRSGGGGNGGGGSAAVTEHFEASGDTYPSLTALTNVTSGSAWTLGSFTEIVPVNTITTDFCIHSVSVRDQLLPANDFWELVLYAGTTEVGRTQGYATSVWYDQNPFQTAIIPANTQIQAKLASETAGVSVTMAIDFTPHTESAGDSNLDKIIHGPYQAAPSISATSSRPPNVISGTGYSYGNWYEMIAAGATSNPIMITHLHGLGSSEGTQYQLAEGTTPVCVTRQATDESAWCPVQCPIVAAGSQVQVRSAANTAQNVPVMIYYTELA